MLRFERQPLSWPAGRNVQDQRISATFSAIACAVPPDPVSDDLFEIRPGRIRDSGTRTARPRSLVAQVRALSNKAGRIGIPGHGRGGTGRNARGRSAALRIGAQPGQRRVLVKARVVRHKGTRFAAAPLTRHISYLKREGVSRDGKDAELFGNADGPVDGEAFAERCAGDRHHFRFIVSPEDAGELADIRTFARELVTDLEKDLGSRLDWVAVEHWNTDNPHIHILVRGKADDGRDLVIDRDYIREGMRGRAEQRVTIELGPRSEREINQVLAREVDADRWTGLDRRLRSMADELGGVVDLRAEPSRPRSAMDRHLIGRAGKLERLGLATRIAPACWSLKPGIEPVLRELGVRGDVIKVMHRAMTGFGVEAGPGRFAMYGEAPDNPVIGRLVERGLHDELTGEAYAVVDGVDGRVHHLRFGDLAQTGDAKPGAIVELGRWEDNRGRRQQSLELRSDLSLAEQVTANGATWLDRQLVAAEPLITGNGFGAEIEQARIARAEHLVRDGLARRQGARIILARDLIATLRGRDLASAATAIAHRTGLDHTPGEDGDLVKGIYRERIKLASGRFAMIEHAHGFELVPWKPLLDRHMGKQVTGTIKSGGGIEWSLGRSRGLAI